MSLAGRLIPHERSLRQQRRPPTAIYATHPERDAQLRKLPDRLFSGFAAGARISTSLAAERAPTRQSERAIQESQIQDATRFAARRNFTGVSAGRKVAHAQMANIGAASERFGSAYEPVCPT